MDWWGSFERFVTAKHWKKLLKAPVETLRTSPDLSFLELYVQWKANVKTFAKVKNWALPFLHEAKRLGNEGKLEDYVLGLKKFFFCLCFELFVPSFFLALYDYVRLMLVGSDGAMLLMPFPDAMLFCGFGKGKTFTRIIFPLGVFEATREFAETVNENSITWIQFYALNLANTLELLPGNLSLNFLLCEAEKT